MGTGTRTKTAQLTPIPINTFGPNSFGLFLANTPQDSPDNRTVIPKIAQMRQYSSWGYLPTKNKCRFACSTRHWAIRRCPNQKSFDRLEEYAAEYYCQQTVVPGAK